MENNDIEFQNIENRNRYISGIVFYAIIFYIISSFISIFVLNFFVDKYSVDLDILNEMLDSNNGNNYLNYLNEEYLGTIYESTINIILKVSSYTNLFTYTLLILGCFYFYRKDFVKDSYIFTTIEASNLVKGNETDTPRFFFFKSVLIWFSVYYGLSMACNIIIVGLNKLLGIDSSFNQLSIEASLSAAAIPIIISAGFLGPIVEELIFRKSIFGIFNNKKIALIVSTLSFGIIHIISSLSLGYNFLELIVLTIPYLTGGAIFGYIYLKTNCNIYYVTIIHMLSNIISLSILLLS